MELTWVALAASLAMGLTAVCIFIFAVKKDYFRDIEDAKYQVFWSDLDEEPPRPPAAQEKPNDGGSAKSR